MQVGVAEVGADQRSVGQMGAGEVGAAQGRPAQRRTVQFRVAQLGPDASAGRRFRAAGQAYTGFALDHPAHFAVMWQRDLLHSDDPELAAAGDRTFELLLGSVREIQSEGWAPGSDPQAVASCLACACAQVEHPN